MNKVISFAILVCAAAGCTNESHFEEDRARVYDGSNFQTNAATELQLRASAKAFFQPMRDAEGNASVTPTASELQALYESGDPSLHLVTTPYFQGKVAQALPAFETAAGNQFMPNQAPAGTGGIYGKYIFSPEGVDLRQGIEKGLFSAAFYNHAAALMNGPMTLAQLDRVLAAFGAHPSFPGDDKAIEHPDEFSASYTERRDKKDAEDPGHYLKIKEAFIDAQQELSNNRATSARLAAALRTIRQEWEKAMLASAIYYFYAIQGMFTTPPSEEVQANALHALGEAMGFIHGWRTVSAEGKIITDAQVDTLLALLEAPTDGPAATYKLLTDNTNYLPKLAQAIDDIAAIYGFTAEELENYKMVH